LTDGKSKRGPHDRRQIAGGQGYEVRYFAAKPAIRTDRRVERLPIGKSAKYLTS